MSYKVLIISPYFPPTNTADMQRVRMSLSYFGQYGWEAEVVTVDERYADMVQDDLLLQSIPEGIKIHTVKALSKKWTTKFALGSIALRSLWYYRKKVNALVKAEKYDLIYFSTTQFPVCILGAYWKKKFNIPYVIDMQDPWHSDYYREKPKEQQPSKYWFSYHLNKYLEPIAIKSCDGLVAVSKNYIDDLKERYPSIKNIPAAVITFGAFEADFTIAANNEEAFRPLLSPGFTNVVYIGRGGADMHKALVPFFEVLRAGLDTNPGLFNKLKIYFIGTSYAATGKGLHTILPLAKQFGVEGNVVEITDRISFYHTLITLKQADALLVPGSDDPNYTASKLYPYLLTGKPLLTIFNSKSEAIDVLSEFGVINNYTYDTTVDLHDKINSFLTGVIKGELKLPDYKKTAEEKYSAKNMTRLQCDLFGRALKLMGETE